MKLTDHDCCEYCTYKGSGQWECELGDRIFSLVEGDHCVACGKLLYAYAAGSDAQVAFAYLDGAIDLITKHTKDDMNGSYVHDVLEHLERIKEYIAHLLQRVAGAEPAAAAGGDN